MSGSHLLWEGSPSGVILAVVCGRRVLRAGQWSCVIRQVACFKECPALMWSADNMIFAAESLNCCEANQTTSVISLSEQAMIMLHSVQAIKFGVMCGEAWICSTLECLSK